MKTKLPLCPPAPEPLCSLHRVVCRGALDLDGVSVDLIQPVAEGTTQEVVSSKQEEETTENITSATVVPARGWILNEQGDVVFVDYDPNNISSARESNNDLSYCHE